MRTEPSTGEQLEYRLLGPVEVLRDGRPVGLGPPKARALLGYLALHAGEVVSTDRLIDALWGERPPARAKHALQVYVGRLRTALEPGRRPGSGAAVLCTRAPGYLLAVERERVDVHRFAALVERARVETAAGRAERAVASLREALGLWRGGLFSDVVPAGAAEPAAARLDELRLVAVEQWVEAELALGRHADVVGELTALVREYPLRERLRGHLMVALHRSGRQADAMRVFTEARALLDEQGLRPGPELGRLQMAILRQEPGLAAPDPVTTPPEPTPGPDPPPAAAPETSELARAATAVHAAVVVAPSADGDLSAVLGQLPDRLAACLEATGGSVVDQGPTAVTAVFGGRHAHEDDPERAVRAALEVVRELDRHGREIVESWDVASPAVRVGVCTGLPPAAGSAGAGPVREATILAGGARPGAVLVDAATRRLVEDQFVWRSAGGDGAVEVTAARRVSGKIRGLPGRAAALVGRDDELAAGRAVLDGALAGSGGVLWLSGEVGLGKTRLLAELRRRSGSARWLQGNCLSYGEGLAHWPIRELLHDWLGVPSQAPGLRVRARLRTRLEELLGAEVLDTYTSLAGLLDLRLDGEPARRAGLLSPEAAARVGAAALLNVLSRLAERHPLVVAVEDVHWADSGSLRLLEAVLGATEDAAIALLVTSRPERGHPSWQLRELARRDFSHRTTEVTLAPLAEDAGAQLLTALVGAQAAAGALGRRLLSAAEGNPFFLEELVRSLPEPGSPDAGATTPVPGTVEQVLGSRVAGLSGPAQQLVAHAAVLGRSFLVRDLVEMMAVDAVPTGALQELAAQGLVVQLRGWRDAEYQFRHALTHQAVYRSLWPPRRRELHRSAAQMLRDRPGQHAATAGALAWHWQQAGEDALAMGEHRNAGRAAVAVHALDVAAHHFAEGLAAAHRLGAAADPPTRNDLLLGLGQVGRLSGDGDPEARLAEALDAATATNDLVRQWQARYELGYWLGYVRGRHRDARHSFERAARLAGQLGEVSGQVAALSKVSLLLADELDLVGALRQAEDALRLAVDAGGLADALDARKLCALFLGELAVFEELLPRLEAMLRRDDELWMLQFLLCEGAVAAAGAGRWTDAGSRLDEADEINRRCGDRVCRPFVVATRGAVARSRGAYGDALGRGREAVDTAVSGAWWASWARTELGATSVELLDLPAAIEDLRPAAETAMFAAQRVRSLALLGWARWWTGSREQALLDLHRAEGLLAAATVPQGRAYLFGADAALACAALRLEAGEPGRAEQLLHPVRTAAETSGWGEPFARSLLLAGRCRGAVDDPTAARSFTARALDVAVEFGLPGVAWRAHAALAGLPGEGGAGQLDRARRSVLELAATLPGVEARSGFTAAALAEVDRLSRRPG